MEVNREKNENIHRFLLKSILSVVIQRQTIMYKDINIYFNYFRRVLKMYTKIENMMDLLYIFTTKQWTFDNSNTKELWSLLSEEDRGTFWYSFDGFDWTNYLKNNFYGIRRHILNEDIGNVSKALTKNRKYVCNSTR